MPTTRFKGETAGERLDKSSISDSDMLQLRHKPGTIEDADKGISKAQLLSCPFGVSDTAAATAAKAADLTDSNPDFTLVSGREVVVCFTTANTASNPTLNFAGSGAIPLYRTNGEAVGSWPADTWMHLKYFYATVGNTTIQRWILLSPLPVNEVAANNMNSVTSNAVADYANKNIKYKQVRLDNITVGSGGYIDIQENFPSGMNNFIFCLMMNFGTNYGFHSFDVNADGRYMRGTPGDNIDYVILRYYYTD